MKLINVINHIKDKKLLKVNILIKMNGSARFNFKAYKLIEIF